MQMQQAPTRLTTLDANSRANALTLDHQLEDPHHAGFLFFGRAQRLPSLSKARRKRRRAHAHVVACRHGFSSRIQATTAKPQGSAPARQRRMAYQEQIPILNPQEAPAGLVAVLKSEAKPSDGSNICRACDWRPQCNP